MSRQFTIEMNEFSEIYMYMYADTKIGLEYGGVRARCDVN